MFDYFQQPSDFTIDRIHRHLRKFGEIASIELLPNRELEAYVTFSSDRSAYLAQLQHEFDREARKQQPFHIEPADTWQQPPEHDFQSPRSLKRHQDDEHEPEMFMLNEDCFLHLFKFLNLDSLVNLSEVCEMFHKLLHQHCFPRFKRFEVNNDGDVITMPLAKMRRTLRCIGPHIIDLRYKNNVFAVDNYRKNKFLKTLVQNVGSKVRHAQFLSSSIFDDNRISIIAPILKNLESLEIYDINYDLSYDVDFEALCPNLIELKLKVNMRLDDCCKSWARLQHLTVTNNEYLNTMTFMSFIEQNPQLRTLEFDIFDADIRLRTVANHLPELQKLTLDSVDSNLAGWHFVHLSQLQHLTEINLLTLDYQHLRSIIDSLATFPALRQISLHAYRPDEDEEDGEQDYERSLIDLGQRLKHLEEFSMRFVDVTGPSLIDFVRFAGHLKILHLHWCLTNICDTLILNLVNTIKLYKPQQREALKLFLNPADLIKLHASVIKSDEVKHYLQVSAKCKHFGFFK